MKASTAALLLAALLVAAAPAAVAAADAPLLRGAGLPRRALMGTKSVIGAALSRPLVYSGIASNRVYGYQAGYYGGNYAYGLNPYAGYPYAGGYGGYGYPYYGRR